MPNQEGFMHWYAVRTKPHQESVAETNLLRQGIETFYPRLQERRYVRRKLRDIKVPAFPGYLFAKYDVAKNYRSVLYSRGVRDVVAFGPSPAIVDQVMIDAIRNRLSHGDVLLSPAAFTSGQSVRIHDGPLHGLEAVFERAMPGHQRAVLLLKALSYQARVVVDLKCVANF
jgi:transcriptional antiterminator RfaH